MSMFPVRVQGNLGERGITGEFSGGGNLVAVRTADAPYG